MERLTGTRKNFVLDNAINAFEHTAYSALDRCTLDFLKELREYRKLEEQGLLHKAPLKDGTPIWHLTEGFDEGAYLTETHYIYNVTEYEIGELGKDFWLSEEAELALVNRQQSHAEAIMDERNGR